MWQQRERVLIGPRKGTFKSKKAMLARKKAAERRALKKLAQESDTSLATTEDSGRELISKEKMFQQLWCPNCDIPMSLLSSQILNKTQKGLGCIYDVKCCKCPYVRSVTTDSTFGQKNEYLVVNAKAAMGMIDSGIGESQLNSLLSAMNVPTVSDKLLKRHERIIGPAIEAVATESCSQSLEMEKALTEEMEDVVHDE